MLVPPQVISRPGDNGSPLSGCELLGSIHPADGPYACYGGKNYSKQGVKELGQALGLLTTEEAQAKFEQVVHRAITAEETLKNRAVESRATQAELEAIKAELEEVRAERDKLAATLAKTKTAEAVVSAAVAKLLNGKEPARV